MTLIILNQEQTFSGHAHHDLYIHILLKTIKQQIFVQENSLLIRNMSDLLSVTHLVYQSLIWNKFYVEHF